MSENAQGNRLFLGDCLRVVDRLQKENYRLVYLDPPFLTGRVRVGSKNEMAYDDRWPDHLRGYLPWLRERIAAMKALLCENGSLVIHLDYRAVHYAKVLLDEIFGYGFFVNEIIWHYTGGGRSKNRFSCKHDTLLWYSRGEKPYFDRDAVRVPYKATSGFARGGIVSAMGKKYLPHPRGTPVDDVWDIPIINPLAHERVGYPTQKPVVLMERLISALSAKGEDVADLFCGSGSTLVAAQRLGRKWTGGDVSPEAVNCCRERLTSLCRGSIQVITI